jgi:hypothetical protein
MLASWFMMSMKSGQEVITMQPDRRPDDVPDADELLHPAYWLVYGLAWPGGTGMAEAAIAISPGMIPRRTLSWGVCQILDCADLYARKRAERVVFFSDLTRMFTTAGTSWTDLGVDGDSALQELQDAPIPALFLTISERAYAHICNAAVRMFLYGPSGAEEATVAERELVRQALATSLTADWPPYIQGMIDSGRLRIAD